MIYYTIYLPNGDITRTGVCPTDDFDLQRQPGELIIEGLSHPQLQWVVDGQIVDLPPSPGAYYVFNYDTKAWEPDLISAAMDVDRRYKDLLTECDWTQLADVTFVDKTAWQDYRQQLRDVPNQPGYPMSVTWPTAPAG